MAPKSSSCPHCGLALLIKPDKTETRFSFDFEEWMRRCKHLYLGSPLLCLVQIASAAPPKEK
jgi:hypothetical protein